MNIRDFAVTVRPQVRMVMDLPELEGKDVLLAAFPKGREAFMPKDKLIEDIDTFRAGVEVDENVAGQIAAIRLEVKKHFAWHDETDSLRCENPELFEEMFTFVEEGDFSLEAVRKLIGERDPRNFLYRNKAIKEEAFFDAVCELLHATPDVVEGLRLLRETIGFQAWRDRGHWEIFPFANFSDRRLNPPDDFPKLRPMLNFFGVKTLALREFSLTPEELQTIVAGCKDMPHMERVIFKDGEYKKIDGEYKCFRFLELLYLDLRKSGINPEEFMKMNPMEAFALLQRKK